jgi:hypothetical protein
MYNHLLEDYCRIQDAEEETDPRDHESPGIGSYS